MNDLRLPSAGYALAQSSLNFTWAAISTYALCQIFGIFLVFYRNHVYGPLKIWLNIGIFFGRKKIGLVFGFRGCCFIGIGLVFVCHFP